MAPTADLPIHAHPSANEKHLVDEKPVVYPRPLKASGSLDKFAFEESTPVIGREYPTLNIVDDILNAPNSDELVRDLAITSNYHPCHHTFFFFFLVFLFNGVLILQSPNVGLFSFALRITLPMPCRSSWCIDWVN